MMAPLSTHPPPLDRICLYMFDPATSSRSSPNVAPIAPAVIALDRRVLAFKVVSRNLK
jgi:hypothetical protein